MPLHASLHISTSTYLPKSILRTGRNFLKERDLDSSTSSEHFTHYLLGMECMAKHPRSQDCPLAHANWYLHCEVPMPSFHKRNLVQTQTDLFESGSGFTPALFFCTVDLSSACTSGACAHSPFVVCPKSPSLLHF